MGRNPRVHYPGGLYHVFTRGNGGKDIFLDELDYRRFVDELAQLKGLGVRFLAYCLMPNHLHLVLRVGQATVSELMHRVLGRYARYFNFRRATFGSVFQSRFKENLIETDDYLLKAIAYVHLNPVVARIVGDPADWRWSGHPGILDRNDPLIDIEDVLGRFGGAPFENSTAAYVEFVKARQSGAHARRVAERAASRDLQMIAVDCEQNFEVIAGDLRSRRQAQPVVRARRLFVRRALDCGFERVEIAAFLGCTPSAISRMLSAQPFN